MSGNIFVLSPPGWLWQVGLVIVLLALVLSGSGIGQAQDQSNICEVILENPLEALLDPAYGAPDAGTTTMSAGMTIEYVGQTPDGESWIVRYKDGYALYPTIAPDLRPSGCEVSMWGAPPPEYRPLDEIMTAVGIDAWHTAGYFGQGVRVGVLDTRFDGLDALLDTIPAQVVLLQPLEELMAAAPEAARTAPYHGTNVLEVLTTIAPQAEYVVTKAATAEQFQTAVDDLIAADVHIIVHAGNVITPDPTPYHDAVRRAADANILWVNSAGNIGAGYYPGRFSGGSGLLPLHQFEDPNRSGLQQGLMVPVNRVGPVSVTVVWEDGAPEQAVNDFTLVVSGNCRLDATDAFQPFSSDRDQATSEADPSEQIQLTSGDLAQIGDYLTVPGTGVQQACPGSAQSDGIVDNEIYVSLLDTEHSAAVDTRFDVYIEGALPAAYDPDITQSLDPVVLPPGDIPESLTIGAFDPRTNQMAWYSGRYNSLQYYAANEEVDYSDDEIVKPDIVTYGEILLPSGRQFFGTSAATPVVGGAAVLITELGLESEPFDTNVAHDLLLTDGIQCLDGDGAIGQVLKYLILWDVNESNNGKSGSCGQYQWAPDKSSSLVRDFISPVEHQYLAVNESLYLSEQALRALEREDTDLALRLALEAVRMDTPPPQAQQILADVAYSPGTRRVFTEHDDTIWAVAFSPDGTNALSGSSDGELILWDVRSGEEIRRFWGHSYVGDVAFSPDGQTALSGGGGQVILWDVGKGEIIHRLIGAEAGGAFSPDGRTALSSTSDFSLVLWDVKTRDEIRRFRGHTDHIQDIAFSPDGRIAVSSSLDFSIIVWNIETGQEIGRFQEHNGIVRSLTFGPDGRSVLSGDLLGTLFVWDVDTHVVIQRMEHDASVWAVALDSDGVTALSGSDNGTLVLWNIQTGQMIHRFRGHTDIISSVVFSPDDYLALTGSWDTTARLWNINNRAMINRWGNQIRETALSPDGHTALVISKDALILTDFFTGKEIHSLIGHAVAILEDSFTPISPSGESVSNVIDKVDGNVASVTSAVFSLDGKLILSGGCYRATSNGFCTEGEMILWNAKNGSVIRRFLGHSGQITTVSFGPNNLLALSASRGGMLRLWDLETGEVLRYFGNSEDYVIDAAFNRDGRIAFSALGDGTIRLWNIENGEEIQQFLGHNDAVTSVAISPDDLLAVSGSLDHSLILWNIETGNPIRHFLGHSDGILSVTFSPNGELILSGSLDGTIVLWDIVTGQPLRRFVGSASPIEDVAFSTDGKIAVARSYDGVWLWRIDSIYELIDWSCNNRYIREFTEEEKSQYSILSTEPPCQAR